jgi:hypothetical protein
MSTEDEGRATWVAAVGRRRARPASRYGPYDSRPRNIAPLTPGTDLEAIAGLVGPRQFAIVQQLIADGTTSLGEIAKAGLTRRQQRRLLASVVIAESPVAIRDIQPRTGRIMSDQPFELDVDVAFAHASGGILRAVIGWEGNPFVVERAFGADEASGGRLTLAFDAKRTLPVGRATFWVSVLMEGGWQASFVLTCAVLPSNPFSLGVAPRDNFVTGSFSARAVRTAGGFSTAVTVTLSNGDSSPVRVRPGFGWEFWDGGVGAGTRIESGAGSFAASDIMVPAFGTWSGWIVFGSPPGSGIFGVLDRKEDLALQITMTKADGAAVRGQITVRTMFRFGLNITRVGAESFTAQEYADLYAAVDVTRQIYERRDVTLSVDRRNITNAQAGGFTIITSEDEARDLFAAWSGPDNDFIDVFIVPQISGTGFDGLAGDIPGPTSHSGRSSGVVAARSGFTDGAGVRHINIPYLGMLIGHEVGHYLGLSHVGDAGNLLLGDSSASDTALNYDPQYRTIVRHGWVRID